jgi:hypothetical protein
MNPESRPEQNQSTDKAARAGFLSALLAVFWSFLGIRRRKDYESDAAKLSMGQVVVAGLIGGVIFVFGVLTLVRVILWYLVPAR